MPYPLDDVVEEGLHGAEEHHDHHHVPPAEGGGTSTRRDHENPDPGQGPDRGGIARGLPR